MMTMVTEVFGVRGELGNLVLEPKLLASQFDESGYAKLNLEFAGKKLEVVYHNPEHKEYGDYKIAMAFADDAEIAVSQSHRIVMEREQVEAFCEGCHTIVVELK